MLPLPKRKNDAAAAAAAMPAWHPNFRNFERLPDTKVVRTAFFINGIAAVIAAIALLWVCYQEYQLHDLNRQIEVGSSRSTATGRAATRWSRSTRNSRPSKTA
jgi:hypothetical protein